MEEITTTAAIGAAVSFSMKAKSTTITAPSSRLALPSVFGDADSGPDESDLASSAGHGEHIEAIVDPTELLFCREEGGRLAERGEFEVKLLEHSIAILHVISIPVSASTQFMEQGPSSNSE